MKFGGKNGLTFIDKISVMIQTITDKKSDNKISTLMWLHMIIVTKETVRNYNYNLLIQEYTKEIQSIFMRIANCVFFFVFPKLYDELYESI